jgi:hypothetical protein
MANIKVNIDVDSGDVQIASDKVLTLQQQIKVLRQELQKTPEGTKEFNALVGKLNDTRDAFDRVNIKGKEIFGTLGLIPGPIGEIAARTNSALDALKVFGSFTVTDLKAQFTALGTDFKNALVTIGKLTGITQVYTVTNNALAKSFVAVGVGEQAAAVGARAFSAALTATGVGLIVVAIGLLAEKVMALAASFNTAEADAIRLQTTLNNYDRLIATRFQQRKEIYERSAAQLKAQGASETELFNLKQKYLTAELEGLPKLVQQNENLRTIEILNSDKAAKTLADINKKYDDNKVALEKTASELRIQKDQNLSDFIVKNREKEATRIATINAKNLQKQEQDAAKAKALKEKELGEIAAGRDEAFLELLTDQEAEEYKVTEQYVKLIDLAAKYGQDTTIFEQALVDKLKEIRDKARADEKEKTDKATEERLAKQKEYDDFIREQYKQIDDLNQQRVDDELNRNAIIAQSWINLGNNIAGVFGSLANVFSENEVLQKAFAIAQVAVNTAASIGQILLSGKQQQADYNKSIAAGNATIGIGIANAFIPGFQGIAAAQIAAGKAAVGLGIAGKAKAAVSTKIQVGAAAITGAAQIAAILSAKKSAPSASGGGGGDTGGGASTPAFSTPTIGAPQIGPTSNQQGQIAGIVSGALDRNNSQGRPIRAYVLGSEITSEQQLNRRLRTAARLGG